MSVCIDRVHLNYPRKTDSSDMVEKVEEQTDPSSSVGSEEAEDGDTPTAVDRLGCSFSSRMAEPKKRWCCRDACSVPLDAKSDADLFRRSRRRRWRLSRWGVPVMGGAHGASVMSERLSALMAATEAAVLVVGLGMLV